MKIADRNIKIFDIKKNRKNINKISIKQAKDKMNQIPEHDNEYYRKKLSEKKMSKSSLKLFKLEGTVTRNIRDIYDTLINHFKFGKNELGGLDFLKCNLCWIFFGNPKVAEEHAYFSINRFGIRVTSWAEADVLNHSDT